MTARDDTGSTRSGAADSAGLPWRGRALVETGFEEDEGAADHAVVDAMARADDGALVGALSTARLIVPIVAEPVELDESGPTVAEKETSMAVVTLVAPDGQRALPVFSSVAALSAWDPAARPVPVPGSRAAQAAVSERCDVMTVDVAGPIPRTLRPSMVWALAQQRQWLEPDTDPVVAESVRRAVSTELSVARHSLGPGREPGVLSVMLTLVPSLSGPQVQALTSRLGERLAADGELRVRIDGLAFTLR